MSVLRQTPLIVVAALLANPPCAATPHRATRILSTARDASGHGCTAYGTGLAVGDGLVLTAAHVLLAPTDLATTCGFSRAAPTRVDVTFGAGPHTARVVAQGRRIDTPRMHFTDASDYAILRVAVSMHSRPLAPCGAPPRQGERVRVLTRTGEIAATVVAPDAGTSDDDAGYADLDAKVANGDSGAGVLDAATDCVIGLVSHRFPAPTPTVTRITPVSVFATAWARARRDGSPPMPPAEGGVELRANP